jgi:hypothetical protein
MVMQAAAVAAVVIEPRLMLVLQVAQAAQDFIPQAVVVVVEMETLHILEPQAAVAVEQLAQVQMLARLLGEQIKGLREREARFQQAAVAVAAVWLLLHQTQQEPQAAQGEQAAVAAVQVGMAQFQESAAQVAQAFFTYITRRSNG